MTDKTQFAGEDENAGFAAPILDLIAAAFLIVLSLWIMIESTRMGSSDSMATAPGLLPFLTAGTLAAMAIGLGAMAIRRRAAGDTASTTDEQPAHGRAILLMAFVGVYLLCLQYLSFDYRTTIGDMELGYGAFEVLTILFLTVLLAVFWRSALWKCLLVSVVWVTLLAAAFRYVFVIPLPGSI